MVAYKDFEDIQIKSTTIEGHVIKYNTIGMICIDDVYKILAEETINTPEVWIKENNNQLHKHKLNTLSTKNETYFTIDDETFLTNSYALKYIESILSCINTTKKDLAREIYRIMCDTTTPFYLTYKSRKYKERRQRNNNKKEIPGESKVTDDNQEIKISGNTMSEIEKTKPQQTTTLIQEISKITEKLNQLLEIELKKYELEKIESDKKNGDEKIKYQEEIEKYKEAIKECNQEKNYLSKENNKLNNLILEYREENEVYQKYKKMYEKHALEDIPIEIYGYKIEESVSTILKFLEANQFLETKKIGENIKYKSLNDLIVVVKDNTLGKDNIFITTAGRAVIDFSKTHNLLEKKNEI